MSEATPADIIVALLVEATLATMPATGRAWPIYATSMPTLDKDGLAVYNTTPEIDSRNPRTGRLYEHAAFQVRIRSLVPQDGYNKGTTIRKYLTEQVLRKTITVQKEVWLVQAITRPSGIIAVGPEEGNRAFIHTFNATCKVEKET